MFSPLLRWLFAGAFCFLASEVNAASALKAAEPWLAVYVNLPDLFPAKATEAERARAIATALGRMQSCGFNTVLPYATTTSGEAMYPSRIVPKRRYREEDVLGVLIRESRARGMRVYPVQCALPAGGEKPAGILQVHPEWALRDVEGRVLGTISPAHPAARAWVASVSAEIVARYQPEGVLLDYLRFPNQPVQLDPESAKSAPLPASNAGMKEKTRYQDLREAVLTEQARLISETVRRAKRDVRVAIYSWGPHVVKNHNIAQNWPLWAKCGYIDIVNLSGYCFPETYGDNFLQVFEKRLTDALEIGARVELTFALGIKTSHGEIKRAADLKAYLEIAQRHGVTGTAVFTWGHLQPFLADFQSGNYLREYARKP